MSYAFQQCKNVENWLRFDKATESLKVGTFFETQCMSKILESLLFDITVTDDILMSINLVFRKVFLLPSVLSTHACESTVNYYRKNGRHAFCCPHPEHIRQIQKAIYRRSPQAHERGTCTGVFIYLNQTINIQSINQSINQKLYLQYIRM